MFEVIDMDHFGRGIVKSNGKVIFVNGAITGETIDFEVTSSKKKYDEAVVTEVKKTSKYRREVPCPYYGKCGGCDIMHMTYQGQKEFKINKIKNILKKYANLDVNPKFVECDKEFNYRNKIVLHKANDSYGFYKKNSNEIIYIKECKIANDLLNKQIGNANKEKEVIFRTCDNEVISNILEKSESFKTINGYKFKLNVNSFFQVNDFIASKLFESVASSINPGSTVLDLYAGVGTLSLMASKNARTVYSVEINPYASKDAVYNVSLNNVKNVEVINASVSEYLKKFDKHADTVIVDPPRSGLDEYTLSFLSSEAPSKIIYISCDPMSLARDLNYLSKNYAVDDVTIFDMFPNTYHTECKVVMSQRKSENTLKY